jgi:predicted DNA-binding transcriptional regulator YafY
VRQLEEARVGAVQVQLVYGAGASPASLRVLPRFLFDRGGHGYMEAECQMSGLLKTYRIDRIQRVDSGAGAGRASGLRPGTGLQRRKSLR